MKTRAIIRVFKCWVEGLRGFDEERGAKVQWRETLTFPNVTWFTLINETRTPQVNNTEDKTRSDSKCTCIFFPYISHIYSFKPCLWEQVQILMKFVSIKKETATRKSHLYKIRGFNDVNIHTTVKNISNWHLVRINKHVNLHGKFQHLSTPPKLNCFLSTSPTFRESVAFPGLTKSTKSAINSELSTKTSACATCAIEK